MCDCEPHVRVQEYQNQTLLAKWWGQKRFISVDTCLVDEIKALWACGIETTGSCCGHNHHSHMAYIGVSDKDISTMKDMGYTVRPNPCRPGDEDAFVPKSLE